MYVLVCNTEHGLPRDGLHRERDFYIDDLPLRAITHSSWATAYAAKDLFREESVIHRRDAKPPIKKERRQGLDDHEKLTNCTVEVRRKALRPAEGYRIYHDCASRGLLGIEGRSLRIAVSV